MTPAALHEQHKARVLDTPRQHHDEAMEALVVEALQSAQQRIRCQRVTGCPDPVDGYTCPSCRSLGKIDAALRVMAR